MYEYTVLDVFTRVPLEGNPLAVFLDASDLDAGMMQRAARELNLSETVFLSAGEPDHDAGLRIFTPATELPFAGHPVLGAAFVVAARTGARAVRLATGAGTVPVTLTSEGGELVYGEMEQPVPSIEAFERAPALLRALGVERSERPVEAYRNGPLHIYVQLPEPAAVAALRPDLAAVADVAAAGVNCYALAGDHVVTRNFSPGLGVPEDPATGSAAGPLAVHLARHGLLAYGRDLEIHQGAAIGRPSELRARVEGGPEVLERVVVGGGAVVVAQGRYRLR